ncbi:VWA domain-containing protein [Streptomyces sp. NPDC020807]|uniref:VWA domain-containing protein n=1 Tax=Streptomyces sp. NPDC020807 TaxID=3155119 RepID=UPI00340C4980
MLRKVFGRDREDTTPATSVPPQTRETTSEGSDTPEAAARRAADDLVAASFDNPQVPKARAETPATGAAGAETSSAVEAEAVEAEAVEAKAPTEAAEPKAAEAEAVDEATAPAEPEAVEAADADETTATVAAEAVETAEATTGETAVEETGADETEATPQAETQAEADTDAPSEAAEATPDASTNESSEPALPAAPQGQDEDPAEPVTAESETAATDGAADADAEAAPAPQAQAQDDDAAEPEATVTTAAADASPATSEAAPAEAGVPATSLAALKAAAPHLADAYKAAGAVLKKQGLTGARAAVYLVVDRSGSMRGYFKDGSVQRLAEQTVALAAHLDEDATVTTVFFSTEIDGTVDLTPAGLTPTRVEEINGTLGRLGRTHYHLAVEEVLAHHEKTDPTRPAVVVFQTDGAPDAKTAATQALAEATAADRPLHWRFVAWGEEENKAFDYLRKIAAAPRTAAYFPGATPSETAHAAFYRGLLAGLEL